LAADATNSQPAALRLVFLDRVPKPGVFYGLEGKDSKEILDKWNGYGVWGGYDPDEFRQKLIYAYGADIELPATEDDILEAIVEASPKGLRLEPALTA
jgi:hypothetical protein